MTRSWSGQPATGFPPDTIRALIRPSRISSGAPEVGSPAGVEVRPRRARRTPYPRAGVGAEPARGTPGPGSGVGTPRTGPPAPHPVAADGLQAQHQVLQ